jgi:type VI secretion system protein ImpG
MIDRYYQEELAHLKELGAEFAALHPALAPMLCGPSADPDVERLLEGVAFQTGLLREKLDDDFPELIHDLVRLICPQYLRPIPATTIVAFAPRPSLMQSQTIAAGTRLESVPVEGTRCQFRTCSPVEIHPLELVDATFAQPSGEAPAIILSMALNRLSLSNWSPKSLRLFLAGEYAAAADLYLLLRRHLRRIIITPEEGGRPVVLSIDSLLPTGFAADEAVIPYPPQAFPGYRLLQEYFTIPNRFLFLDLVGWERWADRGNGSRFTVSFELAPYTLPPPRVKRESFILFAAPAVNLFSHDAEPVLLDHRSERYLVRPAGLLSDQFQVFSVDQVIGIIRGTSRQRRYLPFEHFRPITRADPVYHTTIATSPVHPGFDVHLSVAYPKDAGLPEAETLSIDLTCTNGALPEGLRIGDLCHANGSTPDFATFRNVTPVTPSVMPSLGKNLLWRLVSHLSLNRLSLASAENLRALLDLYLFEDQSDLTVLAANRKRIEGIDEAVSLPADRLVRGIPMRGRELRLRIRGDHFASAGDLFLFGSILDEFLGGYASLNTFTRLTVQEVRRGETIQWQPRLGPQPLL